MDSSIPQDNVERAGGEVQAASTSASASSPAFASASSRFPGSPRLGRRAQGDRPSRKADAKTAIKEEINTLGRARGPGAVAVGNMESSAVDASGSVTLVRLPTRVDSASAAERVERVSRRSKDVKATIKAEMNATKTLGEASVPDAESMPVAASSSKTRRGRNRQSGNTMSDLKGKSDKKKGKEKTRNGIGASAVAGFGATSRDEEGSASEDDGKHDIESPKDNDNEHVVSAIALDEAELAAEYQKELVDNMVEATEVIKDEEEPQRKCCKLCGCLLLVVGIILAIVIPLTRDNDPVIVSPPTAAPTTAFPTSSPTAQSELDFLNEVLFPISGDSLTNPNTSQYKAFEWLAWNDTFFNDTVMTPIKKTNTSILVERYALAVLYFSTGGPQWTSDVKFLSNSSICDWRGGANRVRCNDEGAARFVILNNIGLNGTLPTEFFSLTSLEAVSIGEGSLYGTIPEQIGDLSELFFLEFQTQLLTGTIPQSIERLDALETFNIFANSLTGTIPNNWFGPDTGSNLKNLVLARNALTGTIPEFRTQGNIEWIFLDDNFLEGTLPVTIYGQPSLENLQFSNNAINGTIASAIKALESLKILETDGNELSGTLPSSIGLLGDIEEIDLSGNRFTGKLPSEIGNLDLIKLDVSSNLLQGPLPEELGDLRKLQFLNVASNNLSGSIPSTFLELESLKELFLQKTNITSGLEANFCSRPVSVVQIEADCGGEAPQVDCECCTKCCNGDECTVSVPAVCETKGNAFEIAPDRGASCTCAEDGASMSCDDASCQSCNTEDTVCAVSTDYGYTFNETTGEATSFRNVLQYVKGRNETITFTRDYSKEVCDVEVNGEKCRYCDAYFCASGFEGFRVECDNLEDGFKMNSCSVKDAGYLEVFFFIDPSLGAGCSPLLLNLRP